MNVSKCLRALIRRRVHGSVAIEETVREPLHPRPFSDSTEEWTSGWVVKPPGKLQLESVPKPLIRKPGQVLVRVAAASLNPLDLAMLNGYGRVVLKTIREIDGTPTSVGTNLILGRDFAGEIVAKGNSVRSDLTVGDIVYGVVPPHMQGCHSEFVVADESLVCHKPEDINVERASAILYAGLTAWSALYITGDLFLTEARKKRVLVIGATGGVGSSAVQLLKAWGAEVVATCRTDAVNIVETLNPNLIIDYTSRDALHEIASAGKFDIILDASGSANPITYVPFLKEWANAKFITLRSPFLKNTDSYGLAIGMMRNAADFALTNATSGAPARGASIRWAFFAPLPSGVREISRLVCMKKFSPLIDSVFEYKDLPEAYDKMSHGHARGKIVIKMDK